MFDFLHTKKRRAYLDHASTTPLDPQVLLAMNRVYQNHYYNPENWYKESVITNGYIINARKTVADILTTQSSKIIFTSGGTESNHLALTGAINHYRSLYPNKTPHIICSSIEHASVLEQLTKLEQVGIINLSIAPVDTVGIVDLESLKKLITPDTILISVMYVNNEIGSIQPILDIAKLIRWYKKHHNQETYPLFHTDAVQAANYLDLSVTKLGVDSLSLSGSKIYGPKSAGCVYLKNPELYAPILTGGNQQFNLRAGTVDVALCVGFAQALQQSTELQSTEIIRLRHLQQLVFSLFETMKNSLQINSIINGPSIDSGNRIVNNIHISFDCIGGEELVIALDALGYCVSTRSACSLDDEEESHVIKAIRNNQNDQYHDYGALRITLGQMTRKSDIQGLVRAIETIIHNKQVLKKKLSN